jgi:ribosomal protein L11 methyltransferase
MANHIQLLFRDITTDQSAILIAELNEAGYEGFEEGDTELKAFIASDSFDKVVAGDIAKALGVSFSVSTIEETNWNEVWESNFQPVVVEDFVGLRAHFHEPLQGVEHEIVITPKMSFGTGHHATTYMMMRQMKDINFNNKTVFDFGTGTGILAILADKLGARQVLAIDNDDWSIANSRENILQNNAAGIEIRKGDTAAVKGSFDIILANINKNVIMDNMADLKEQLAPEGVLLISGLLTIDEADIREKAGEVGFTIAQKLERHNWLCLNLSYKT